MAIRTKLSTDLASVSEARRIVADELASAGCNDNTIEDARLLTSELATNAVRHATGTDSYDLTVQLDRGVLHVGLTDSCADRPRVSGRPPDEAESGRGMWLVDLIAEQWGVEPSPPGKRVWFEMPCQPPRRTG